MGQQDNTRVNSVLYLHAVPPLSIYVCTVPVQSLISFGVIVFLFISFHFYLFLDVLAAHPEYKEGKARQGSRVRLMTRDSSCLRPGWWAERAGLAFSCQPPAKACAQSPSTAFLWIPPNLWMAQAVLFPSTWVQVCSFHPGTGFCFLLFI